MTNLCCLIFWYQPFLLLFNNNLFLWNFYEFSFIHAALFTITSIEWMIKDIFNKFKFFLFNCIKHNFTYMREMKKCNCLLSWHTFVSCIYIHTMHHYTLTETYNIHFSCVDIFYFLNEQTMKRQFYSIQPNAEERDVIVKWIMPRCIARGTIVTGFCLLNNKKKRVNVFLTEAKENLQ